MNSTHPFYPILIPNTLYVKIFILFVGYRLPEDFLSKCQKSWERRTFRSDRLPEWFLVLHFAANKAMIAWFRRAGVELNIKPSYQLTTVVCSKVPRKNL